LTDDTIRENLRKFGNPDGQQPREDKIAIPKWIVEGNNGFWILALYGLGLGGGIPFVVVSPLYNMTLALFCAFFSEQNPLSNC
jgi:preprotein translocase subunit Sec63